MYKYLILIPVCLLFWQEFKVFEREDESFFIRLGILSSAWITLAIFSYVMEIPLVFSLFILIRGLIYFYTFIHILIKEYLPMYK